MNSMNKRPLPFLAAILAMTLLPIVPAAAQKTLPGVTDTEIKIGNIMSYTGAFREYGSIGRAEAAYFQMINDRGGINGRKINFLSVDGGSEPGKSADLARKLVEEDGVLLIFSPFGTENNLAMRPYLNEQ